MADETPKPRPEQLRDQGPEQGPEGSEEGAGPGHGFADRAAGAETSFWREFAAFLVENKRWWLIPLIAVLALMAGFLFLGSGPLAPFVYTLF